MTTLPSAKLPAVCFIVLSVTLFVGGLGMLGAAVILFKNFPAGTPIYLVPLLALNGLLGWILTVLCSLSAWKLATQKPKARAFSGLAWALVAGFIVWMLLVECLSGWSTGAIIEIVIWSVLEALIGNYLMKTRRAGQG
jgi:hypothetical protein